jgi:hypothetical protein
LHHVGGDPGYMIYPFYNAVVFEVYFAHLVLCLKVGSVSCRIPWDTRYDDFYVVHVGGMVGHPEGLEAFPCPALLVPKIFDSSTTKIDNGLSFIATIHSQKVTNCHNPTLG